MARQRTPSEEAADRSKQALRETAASQFTYHPPVGDQGDRHRQVRRACLDTALILIEEVPSSWELQRALQLLREVMMWSNAGISCNPTVQERAAQATREAAIAAEADKATGGTDAPGMR